MSSRSPASRPAAPESGLRLLSNRSRFPRSELASYVAEVQRVPLLTRDDEREIGLSIDAAETAILTAALSRRSGRAAVVRLASEVASGAARICDVVHVEPAGAHSPSAIRRDAARLLRAAAEAGDREAIAALVRLRLTRASFEALRAAVEQERQRGAGRTRVLDAIRDGLLASDRAKARLIESNLRLVIAVAAKVPTSRLALSDLVQEGNLGLLRAVDKFDYTRGYKFSTYAMWWIKQHIKRGLIDRGSTIRIPVHASDAQSRVRRAQQRLSARWEGTTSVADVAAECALPVAHVTSLLALPAEPASLDAPLRHDSNASLLDHLRSDASTPDEQAVENEERARIAHLLEVLRTRHRQVLQLRYGLVDGRPRTLAEVGVELGMTRERVRQIEQAALSHLRSLPEGRARARLDTARTRPIR